MKKLWWIIGIVVVLAAAGIFAWRALAARSQAAATTLRTAAVTRGEISTSLSLPARCAPGKAPPSSGRPAGRWGR